MPVNTHSQRDVYLGWWVGKYCRVNIMHEYKKVIDVITYGPHSYVYGTAVLVMEDGEEVNIPHRGKKPRKTDVEVNEQSEVNFCICPKSKPRNYTTEMFEPYTLCDNCGKEII